MYVYYTSGGRSRGKTVSSPRKRLGARQRNPSPGFIYHKSIGIYIYIYTHTLVVTVICEEFVHTLYVLYLTNIRVTTFQSRLKLCGNKNSTTIRDSV